MAIHDRALSERFPDGTGERRGERGRVRGAARWKRRLKVYGVVLAFVPLGVIAGRITGCAERLFYFPEREADIRTPSGVEDVLFESEGLTLHGWFMPAIAQGLDADEGPDIDEAGRDAAAVTEHGDLVTPDEAGSLPTVVFCHGNAMHIERHEVFVAFLRRRGFNVFMFDYRGYGRSDAGPLRRDRLIADAVAAIDTVAARADVDPDRIGLMGMSLGGTIGLAAATERDRVRSVCSVVTFSAWPEVASDHAGWLGRFLIARGRDAEDSVALLGERPLLLVHGTEDRVVPYRHAPLIRDAAVAAGVETEFVTIDGANHVDWIESGEARDAISGFFERTLSPR
ncbi:MAG: alpha/beta fold hydrolase [Planctomycetota bacterium]